MEIAIALVHRGNTRRADQIASWERPMRCLAASPARLWLQYRSGKSSAMNEADKVRINARYDHRPEQFGPSIDALASGTDERRRLRFETMLAVGVSAGDHVLDLGCGFGDLYAYLSQRGLDVEIHGPRH